MEIDDWKIHTEFPELIPHIKLIKNTPSYTNRQHLYLLNKIIKNSGLYYTLSVLDDKFVALRLSYYGLAERLVHVELIFGFSPSIDSNGNYISLEDQELLLIRSLRPEQKEFSISIWKEWEILQELL